MRTQACLDCLAATRDRVRVPLVPRRLFVAARGLRLAAIRRRRSAGATSLIVADLGRRTSRTETDPAGRTTSSTDERLRLAGELTDGWLYLVTRDRDDRRPFRPFLLARRARRARTRRGAGRRPLRRLWNARPRRTHAQPPSSPTASSSAPAPTEGRRGGAALAARLRAARSATHWTYSPTWDGAVPFGDERVATQGSCWSRHRSSAIRTFSPDGGVGRRARRGGRDGPRPEPADRDVGR